MLTARPTAMCSPLWQCELTSLVGLRLRTVLGNSKSSAVSHSLVQTMWPHPLSASLLLRASSLRAGAHFQRARSRSSEVAVCPGWPTPLAPRRVPRVHRPSVSTEPVACPVDCDQRVQHQGQDSPWFALAAFSPDPTSDRRAPAILSRLTGGPSARGAPSECH